MEEGRGPSPIRRFESKNTKAPKPINCLRGGGEHRGVFGYLDATREGNNSEQLKAQTSRHVLSPAYICAIALHLHSAHLTEMSQQGNRPVAKIRRMEDLIFGGFLRILLALAIAHDKNDFLLRAVQNFDITS